MPKCRICSQPFTRTRPLQPTCLGPCEYEFAVKKCAEVAGKRKSEQAKKAKAERKTDRARRHAMKKIPALIAIAQAACNAFIRERDKDKGCFVCLRPFDQNIPGRALHAGHIRSRGAAGHLRLTEDNILGECEGCNGPRGAKPHQIKAGAIARIGAERFAELENDNTPHKWTREELEERTQYFRAKLRALKAERSIA